MADPWTKEQRSRVMSRVKNKNTGPEIRVRSLLHRLGFRFRIQRRDLPGAPDIVLPRYRTVVFVHGCFWHGHDCPRGKRPSSHTEFWDAKLFANLERDRVNKRLLEQLGWAVLVVWQCELKDMEALAGRLAGIRTNKRQNE